ncbi:V-type ATP synthase subunit D [Candidatus Woesearchaeota archaeon]|nr:V-type ATP synthase subunit D [Candidatus Woesearchaeota archaeon]
MPDVKPTRSELIALKKKIKLAKSGYNLLKKKRDGLILEFFEVLKKVKESRGELTEIYRGAIYKMSVTRTIENDLHIKSIALAITEGPEVSIEEKNVMGLRVPKISGKALEKNFMGRGYGLLSSSIRIDETADAYERVVEKVIIAAEVEITLKKLLNEIEKTKRKVNALEQIVIPRMESSAAYIRMRLEEMERENFSRLKLIKKRI